MRHRPDVTARLLEQNLAGVLWDAAATHPARIAVIEAADACDYGRLCSRAAAVAAYLAKAGFRPDDRVGVFLDGGVDALAAFFGVLAAGGIAIAMNEFLRPRQIEHMVEDAGVVALITETELLERQPRPLDASCRILDMREIPAGGEFQLVSRVPGDPAQITYTSGSTGMAKGATVSHGNLRAAMETVTGYLGITAEDRIASILPFSFVYGMSQVLCAVGSGAALVVERSPLVPELVRRLRAREITVLAAVPPLWTQLLNVKAFREDPLPSLRIMTNAGGHLPVKAVRLLREAQPQAKLFLMYGLTEVLRSTYLPADEVDRRPDSIGRAIPGAEVLVLRDDLAPCAPGEVGELVHRGPTVTLGYWNDPEGTASVFRPNPLRPPGTPDTERVVFSGDLVRRDEDGFLYFVGRRDRMIKTLGYRVSPDEIANVLYASGEIVECVVASEPDEQRGERILAFVVPVGEGSLERVKAYCETELPRHMQPARFEVRESLPRLPSGKHDVAAVREERKPV